MCKTPQIGPRTPFPMMKILYVNQYSVDEPMGAERSALNAAIGLSERGHEVHFLHCGEEANRRQLDIAGQKFVSISVESDPPNQVFSLSHASKRLHTWLSETNLNHYDIIHSHNSAGHMAISDITTDSPCVGTVRDYKWLCEGGAMCYSRADGANGCSALKSKQLEYCDSLSSQIQCSFKLSNRSRYFFPVHAGRIIYQKRIQDNLSEAISCLDSVISISKFMGNILERKLELDNRVNIYNSVVRDSYYGGEEKEENRIIYVGALTNQKGIIHSIKAINDVIKDGYDIKYSIAGDGSVRPRAEELVETYGISDYVEFLGHVGKKEVIELFNRASLVLYPSIWPEPFGRISIEAMATKSPIVGSKFGAIPEVLQNWPAKEIVNPTAKISFKNAIENMIEKNYNLDELKIEDRFTHSRAGLEHEKHYESLINKK